MTIKVTPKDKSIEPFELNEHSGPVLRIDLSANGLLASSSGDGTIKIWNLDEQKCIKTIAGFDKIKSYQETEVFGRNFCMIRWNECHSLMIFFFLETVTPSFEPKHGKFMAYNQDKNVIIVDTKNWAVQKTLSDEKVTILYADTIGNVNALFCLNTIRINPNTVCVHTRNVANI